MPKHFIQPPVGGIKRQLGFQSQEPFTTVESMNMLPFDPLTGRKSSATRPPVGMFPSPGGTVNLLARVNGDASQTPQTSMVAAAGGAIFWWDGADWVPADMGMVPLAVDTDRTVFSTTFLKKVFILNSGQSNEALVFDYEDNTVAVAVASAGTFPSGCRVGATWQGGIWLAGNEEEPHVFSGSRTGDPLDWNFAAPITDTGGAFTATGEAFGLIGDPITAMIPLSGDVLIIACENSIWALKGHPRRGGTLEQVSSVLGVLGQGAWAKGPDGKVYFLSHAGLCVMDGGGNAVAPISRDYIPDELFLDAFDMYDPMANLAFDPRFNGIHLTIRGDEEQAWWFDLDTSGFHQQSYATYPYVMLHFPPVEAEGQSGVLFGGMADPGYGGIGRFDTTATEDYTYRTLVGPMKMAAHLSEQSRIQFAQHLISGGTTEDNPNMYINFWVGATNEDVYNRYLTDDLSCKHVYSVQTMIPNGGRIQPRAAGAAMMIEVYGVSTTIAPSRAVYEGTEIETVPAGRNRRLPGRVGGIFDPSASFNPSRWAFRARAVPDVASGDMNDIPFYLDMSELPAGFFTAAHVTARDVRAATDAGVMLAIDIIAFDKVANTGTAVIKGPARTTSQAVNLYSGNPNAYAPGADSKIGRYSAYRDSVRGFYPTGSGSDRTRNGLDLTPLTATDDDYDFGDTTVGFTSPIVGSSMLGFPSSRYTVPAPAAGSQLLPAVAALMDLGPTGLTGLTLSGYVRVLSYFDTESGVGETVVNRVGLFGAGTIQDPSISTDQRGGGIFLRGESGLDGGDIFPALSQLTVSNVPGSTSATYDRDHAGPTVDPTDFDSYSEAELSTASIHHVGAIYTGVTNAAGNQHFTQSLIVVDGSPGTAGASSSTELTASETIKGYIVLGTGNLVGTSLDPGFHITVQEVGASYELGWVMILDETMPFAFHPYHAAMRNQATFWNGWTQV